MFLEQTISKLNAMKLYGMAQSLQEQIKSTEISSLSFEDRISMLVDAQWNDKENRAYHNRIRRAQFKIKAYAEDINYRTPRGLTKQMISPLTISNWINDGQNCIITGPTGVGKTYLGCAIGEKACRNGFNVRYFNVSKLFREIGIADDTGKLPRYLMQLQKLDLLVFDDWGFDSLDQNQFRLFLEILDDRHESKSTLITSQYPIKHWFDSIGNQTIADAILDRLIHNCHKMELAGESMRKLKSKQNKNQERRKK